MSKELYYTPTIKEFHPSFEFEQDNGYEWVKRTYEDTSQGIYSLKNAIVQRVIRVKYLDREDIESLGLNLIESEKSNYWGPLFERRVEIGFNTYKICRLHLGQKSQVVVGVSGEGSWGGSTDNIQMTIKNKSELKRILKQIGI